MGIIRHFTSAGGSCRVCGGVVDLPHETDAECRAALSRELDALLTRARLLSTNAWKLAVKQDKAMARRAGDGARQSKQKRR